MNQDLTQGRITSSLLRFAWPFMVGNLLQQLYNVVDTLIVGRYLGSNALGAVGSSYTLMTFLTSILLGLCMGSGKSCPSVSRESGCRCPSAGFWPMWWAFCATAVFAAGTAQCHLPEHNDHLPALPRQNGAAVVW